MTENIVVPNTPKKQVQRGKIIVDGITFTYKILKDNYKFINRVWKKSQGLIKISEPLIEGEDDSKILANTSLKAAKLNREIEIEILNALDVQPAIDPTEIRAFKLGKQLLGEVIAKWFSDYFLDSSATPTGS